MMQVPGKGLQALESAGSRRFPQLIAIDLDGTLLDNRGRISQRNKRAIDGVRARGAEVVIVTFRAYRSAKPYVLELGLHLPLLCCNGALVKDTSDDRVLESFPIDPKAARLAVDYGVQHGYDQCLYIGEHYVAHQDVIDKYSEGYAQQWRRCDDLRQCLNEPTLMVRYFGDRRFERAEKELEHLGFEHVQDLIRDLYELSLMRKGVSKGSALVRLARDRGIATGEIVAIGDGALDASMLEAAGLGIAMAGAAPEALAAADLVTAGNDEDGVAQALESLIRLAP